MEKNAGGRPKINLSCKDIVDIIKCGKEHKVIRLIYGSLCVVYHESSDENPVNPLGAGQQPITQKEIEDEMTRLEVELKNDELANLAVTDPEQFEELLARGDLMETTNEHTEGE